MSPLQPAFSALSGVDALSAPGAGVLALCRLGAESRAADRRPTRDAAGGGGWPRSAITSQFDPN